MMRRNCIVVSMGSSARAEKIASAITAAFGSSPPSTNTRSSFSTELQRAIHTLADAPRLASIRISNGPSCL